MPWSERVQSGVFDAIPPAPAARTSQTLPTRFVVGSCTKVAVLRIFLTTSRTGKQSANVFISRCRAARRTRTRVSLSILHFCIVASILVTLTDTTGTVVMASLAKGVGPKPVGPRHDAAPEPIHPAPVATPQAALLPVPKRVADGMPLAPTQDYLADVASPKSGTASLSAPKLVVFDLDGTVRFFFVPPVRAPEIHRD